MKEGTFICQTKYVKDMLKKFDMTDAKLIKTLMVLNGHLDLNEEGKSVDQKVYRSMIGSLLTFVHLGLILRLVSACVQDFKPIPRNVT
jgi:hypothetical protein